MIKFFILAGFLCLLVICMRLYFRYSFLKRELFSISAQIETLLRNKTFSYVTCVSDDRVVRQLACDINGLVSACQSQESTERRKNREILRVMTNISHDLRTPLTILFGYIEMLVQHMKEENVSEKTQTLVQKLSAKTQAANRMISQLLDMSRINSGDYPMKMETINLTKVCHNIFLDYYDRLHQLGFEVDLQTSEKEILLMLDKGATIRIIRNLIDNVIIHAGEGKYIGLRIMDNECNVELHVLDHGHGIPDSDKGNIFKRGILLSEETDGSTPSHGLGLSIAWSLARMMNSELYLAQSSSSGSDFCWRLKK